ncbi:MAG: transglutaminase domain-containing protein, partial [Planctomycetes bacterium]|nr:transglutaminase domain-containing protein [Planctomycetota bacterium]
MPTDATFRFCTYLALALSCLALGYAEHELLPEVPAFAGLAVLGLGTLYFLESRVKLLAIPAANRLGLVISVLYLAWAGYRINREFTTNEFAHVGWQMLIVALCGPLVMLVLVAKVARADKHAGDYWTLHGIALAGVGMAAAFAEEPACFVLVGLYLVATVWSLTLLHLGRARGAIPPIPGGKQPATKAVAVSTDPTGHRTDLRPALLWAVLAVTVAVPLYLLTPRSTAGKVDFGKPKLEIAYGSEQMVDLNKTGPLKPNKETAFEVTATYPDGRPKTDLNPETRWRGRALRIYSNGEWKPMDEQLPPITPRAANGPVWAAPDLGPGQFTVTFEVEKVRATFTADPMLWVAGQPAPCAVLTDDGPQGWMPLADGSYFWDPGGRARPTVRRYVQAYRTNPDPDVGPEFRFVERYYGLQLAPLLHNPVTRVKEYADELVNQMIARRELPKDCRDPVTLNPLPRYQDKVARAFAALLATTPDLRYTTDLKRTNQKVDPVEDFLFHTKAGHCERFASALVLMLRSQGIPAMYVRGMKGCEHLGDGRYAVRHEFAHAWVTALVAIPDQRWPVRDPRDIVFQWRSLDPTPGAAQVSDADANKPWWKQANSWVESKFNKYLSEYTPEQRRQALVALGTRATRTDTLAVAGALVAGVLAVRAARR